MKRFWRMAAVLLVSGLAVAQMSTTTTTAKAHTPKKKAQAKQAKKKPAATADLEDLKIRMQAQQDQIDALKSQLADRDQKVSVADQNAAAAAAAAQSAQARADAAASSSQDTSDKVTSLQSTVSDLKATSQGLQETLVGNQARIREEIESPAALHYKGLTITPVAFFAFEGVWRQRSLNSDINTPFNSIPMPSAVEGHVSELNFSGRQSRLGGLFEGDAGSFRLSGYAEMDFLGTGTSSNNNQSNSYVLRQRQIWGKAETAGGFAVTGGQMWSLVTEDGFSTNARTEKLPNTIDPQYMVGFSWTRQPAIRLQQRFGDVKTGAFTVALALEQAQITNFTAASATSGAVPTDYFFAGAGQNGGLYNAAAQAGTGNAASTAAITTYANNVAPDVVVKGALDVPHAHFEFGGLARFLRDYYYPVLGASSTAYAYGTNYVSNTATAGGVFGSARVSPSRYVDVAVQAMAGTGVGRYGSAQLADATLRPNETLEPIKNYHGMFSVETHPTPKLDVFAYYGGEYAQRTVYTVNTGVGNFANGATIGYGTRNLNDAGCYLPSPAPSTAGTGGAIAAPSTCASPTRYVQEDMIGFTYRVTNSPKYGRLQYSMTYSYLQRNLWSGSVAGSTVANAPTGARALNSMVHVGMRYYIP